MLKVKTLKDILSSSINWINRNSNKLTDFNVGSATRTLLEAIALQIEELYFKMFEGFMWAVEESIYKAFGFEIQEATYADGYIMMEFIMPLSESHKFEQGLEFCTSPGVSVPKYYKLSKDIIAPKGTQKILLPIVSKNPGEAGNTPSHSINVMITPNSSISKVYNPYPLTNGHEKETKSERKVRFFNFIKTLARGTTDAIVYGASQVPGIKGVWVDDSEIGLVKVFAHDENGDLPAELKETLLKKVMEYKAAGVEVVMCPVIKTSVDVNIEVLIGKDYDGSLYQSIVTDAVRNYFSNFQVNQNLYVTDLIQYLMNLDDLAIISVNVKVPDADIITTQQQLIRPGNVNITIESIR